MSKIDSKRSSVSRRNFLHKAMLAITGSAMLAQTNAASSKTKSTPKPKITDKQPSKSGYRETEHIRNYYKSAGL